MAKESRTGIPTSGCPLVHKVEKDYKYVKKVVQILDSIGKPYFISGGSGMAMLRFGAISIHPNATSERHFAFDHDLEFLQVFDNDTDFHASCEKFRQKCEDAKIFKECSKCWARWPREDSNMIIPGREDYDPDVSIRRVDDTHDGNLNVAWRGPRVLDRDIVFPLRKAKYYDIAVPVAQNPMDFFKHVPLSGHAPLLEYGKGCEDMAFPLWLKNNAEWGPPTATELAVKGLNIPRGILSLCANALDAAGFASFSSCFFDPSRHPLWKLTRNHVKK